MCEFMNVKVASQRGVGPEILRIFQEQSDKEIYGVKSCVAWVKAIL